MGEAATLPGAAQDAATQHFDVIIVGAGISGVGGAYHLRTQRPGTKFVVLEALESFGGTWLTHTYPGIRSDSDLYTFGYRFKPWTGAPIATAEEIRNYMGEVIEENDLGRHIRYGHKIRSARWSSKDNLWTIEAVRADTGETARFTANFLWMCQGYYRHSEGYTPEWKGMESFKGEQHHSSQHPGGDRYRGKKCVVIGSNNSAHDICADLWEHGADVTMVQRSSTHIARSDTLMDLALGGLYSEQAVKNGITTDKADLIFASVPYKIMHTFHIPVYQEMAKRDADLYARLKKVGFMLDFGEDGSGLFMKYLRRGSLWEAYARLDEARTQAFRVYAALNGAAYPRFGLTSILDSPGLGVPDPAEKTVAGLDPDALRPLLPIMLKGRQPLPGFVRVERQTIRPVLGSTTASDARATCSIYSSFRAVTDSSVWAFSKCKSQPQSPKTLPLAPSTARKTLLSCWIQVRGRLAKYLFSVKLAMPLVCM